MLLPAAEDRRGNRQPAPPGGSPVISRRQIMTNTIMVTGAGGLVGSSVCRRLAAAGRPVVGLDRF